MNNSQPSTREELYERIRQSSKSEVILEEMIRLGFWKASEPIAVEPTTDKERRLELEKELSGLRGRLITMGNEERFKRDYRKKRMEESRRRREENKERRLKEQAARREAWAKRKATDILYLGENYSAGLNSREEESERLGEIGLPSLPTATAIAEHLNISLERLKFLAFAPAVSKTTHYVRYKVPKKSGGVRKISAPMPELKAVQEQIMENILYKLPPSFSAHGFIRERSIVTNALPHVGAEIVVNIDLKNFFPTIGYPRIKGLFASFGYSEFTATILALLCSEPDVDKVKFEGESWYVIKSERYLPQGAPTSPAISNLICRNLDLRLERLAARHSLKYSRYADDLTFSTGQNDLDVNNFLKELNYAVFREGFRINKKKTRLMRKFRRQEVTGITVNQKANVSRKMLKRFRALLFQIEKDGPQGKSWGNSNNLFASIKGYTNYVSMVNPRKGAEFREQIERLTEKYL